MGILSGIVLLCILLLVGWLCRNRPTTVVRLLTAHLNLTNMGKQTTKGYAIANSVRQHSETWPERYPDLFQLIQLMGLVAYWMLLMGLLILISSWLTQEFLH